VTRGIPARLAAAPDHDPAEAERICRLVAHLCAGRGPEFLSAVDDFIAASTEVIRLQRLLERTGRYHCPSFAAAKREVYDDHAGMATTYLNGLLLSQALWINHQRIVRYFREEFCAPPPLPRSDGAAPIPLSVLEVPVGTGVFLSEFLRRDPTAIAVGLDLSPVAVELATRLIRSEVGAAPRLHAADILAPDLDHLALPASGVDRIICGELLEHVDDPEALLATLDRLLAVDGRLFLTTAIWAASPDHVYLFESAAEVRQMLERRFVIESERVLPIEPGDRPNEERVPLNYASVLRRARASR
jgi:SAM-dependent methyltransferase